jgi:hypothetical protein
MQNLIIHETNSDSTIKLVLEDMARERQLADLASATQSPPPSPVEKQNPFAPPAVWCSKRLWARIHTVLQSSLRSAEEMRILNLHSNAAHQHVLHQTKLSSLDEQQQWQARCHNLEAQVRKKHWLPCHARCPTSVPLPSSPT